MTEIASELLNRPCVCHAPVMARTSRLAPALDIILARTFSDFEPIVIDDGSS
jgi:hypothetical protein